MIRGLTTALLLLFRCASTPSRTTRAPRPETPYVEVMTYNVNYGLAGDQATLEAIGRGESDLVLLQETNEKWERLIRRTLGTKYPYMEFHHCCGAGGLAVLSRHVIRSTDYLPAKVGW